MALILVARVSDGSPSRLVLRAGALVLHGAGHVTIQDPPGSAPVLLRLLRSEQQWLVEATATVRVLVDGEIVPPGTATVLRVGVELEVPAFRVTVQIDGDVAQSRSADLPAEQPAASPPQPLHGHPPTPAPSAPDEASDAAHEYPVWFATNRNPLPTDDPDGFGNDFDAAGRVHHGICTVRIPKTHKFGSVGRAWWRRWLRLEFADDRLRCISRRAYVSEQDFLVAVNDELQLLPGDEQQVLVYLHGYKNSFGTAAIRAAQICFDLRIPGVTAFFAWPSLDSVTGYLADQDRIEASEGAIADFLMRVATLAPTRTHIIAHSMGNRGLARAIQRIVAKVGPAGVRFGQILLAAPDISVEVFRQLADVYPRLGQRTTMYASSVDRALAASGMLHAGSRAGFTPPLTHVPGIDTVDVSGIDLSVLGHSYYAEAAPVLYDMLQLLHEDAPPHRRVRLRASRSATGPEYWTLTP
jgi:esterase/lipase superfamily enzyme